MIPNLARHKANAEKLIDYYYERLSESQTPLTAERVPSADRVA
jgi:hypothetical protein